MDNDTELDLFLLEVSKMTSEPAISALLTEVHEMEAKVLHEAGIKTPTPVGEEF